MTQIENTTDTVSIVPLCFPDLDSGRVQSSVPDNIFMLRAVGLTMRVWFVVDKTVPVPAECMAHVPHLSVLLSVKEKHSFAAPHLGI